MPTIAAGSYPVALAPTVDPAATPNSFQRIDAEPAAFGVLEGQATSRLAGEVNQAGGVFAKAALERQDLYNKVTADQATNDWQDATNKILYGDPNKPGDTGFFGLKGQDAMSAYPGVRNAIFAAREAHGAGLNQLSKLQFDNETRRLQSYMVQSMGRHYDQQMTSYTIDQAKAGIANGTTSAIGAANSGNDDLFVAGVARAEQAIKDLARANGQKEDDPTVVAEINKLHNSAIKAKAEYLRITNPLEGVKYLETNADKLNTSPEEYEALHEQMKNAAKDMQANIDAKIVKAPAGWNSSQAGGNPKRVEIMNKYGKIINAASVDQSVPADLIASIIAAESGGNPKSDNVVGGGSHVQGLGNILDATQKHLGITDPFDPTQNINGIAKYLREGLTKYNGDITKTLKYYYGGSNEAAWGPATDAYPAKVNAFMPKQVGANAPPTVLNARSTQAGTPTAVAANIGTNVVTTDKELSIHRVDIPGYTHGDVVIPPSDDPNMPPDSQFPGLSQQIDQNTRDIVKDNPGISPKELNDRVKAMTAKLREQYNLAWKQNRNQNTLDKEASAKAAAQIKDQYITRMAPGSDNPPTIKEIMADPRLNEHPEVKENLVAFAERNGKEDPAAATDAAVKNDLYRRIHLPYGTPGKITSDQDLIAAYTSNPPQITYNSVQQLKNELRDTRTSDGENLSSHKKRVLTTATPFIYGPSAMTQELRDLDAAQAAMTGRESADQRLSRYLYDLDQKIKEFQGNNKDPNELFNPKSPSYFASPETLKAYGPPMAEKLQTGTSKTPVKSPTPAAPPGATEDLSKLSDKDFIARGRGTTGAERQRFNEEAYRRGLLQRPTTAPNTP